jgi:hypothetical protein
MPLNYKQLNLERKRKTETVKITHDQINKANAHILDLSKKATEANINGNYWKIQLKAINEMLNILGISMIDLTVTKENKELKYKLITATGENPSSKEVQESYNAILKSIEQNPQK